MKDLSFRFSALRAAYQSGELTPREVVAESLRRIAAVTDNPIWIRVLTMEELEPYLTSLPAAPTPELPLYGLPFAIKDNIDLAGIPTTAGCPEFASVPERSAFVVRRLIAAGAIPIGKTNLDQFATGLVGTRSPFGACRNAIDPEIISGGSSSGSAVAVALDLISFSLGTDTAGSGRVPAFLNGLFGWKPTRGLLSNSGVVPACRSLDCVSVFTLDAKEAAEVAPVVAAFDPEDAFARRAFPPSRHWPQAGRFRFGVPPAEQLEWFGEKESAGLFAEACARLEAVGGQPVPIDLSPFLEAAELLYGGPWVAERYLAIESFLAAQPEAVFPVTRKIIEGGARPSAADAFRAQYALEACRRRAEAVWEKVDCLCLPTIGRPYTIAEVEADPIQLNTNLGYYTNFMNLLDLAAVAVPTGAYQRGLPFGVTLCAPAMEDGSLLAAGAALEGSPFDSVPDLIGAEERMDLLVCGAHMRGLALNNQLLELGGRFVEEVSTAPIYRCYALTALNPPRPGLIEDASQGASIAAERWSLPTAAIGKLLSQIAPPLGLGTLTLADGTQVKGFICAGLEATGAAEITPLGGWRAYIRREAATG
jgi:allophanate hydrolase